VRELKKRGYESMVTLSRADELELTDQAAVNAFFAEKIDQVQLAAANVSAIHANNTLRPSFYQHLMMQSNAVHPAHTHGVRKLLFLGSSCIFTKAPYPHNKSD
jgi:GDP-L-fucose synthase